MREKYVNFQNFSNFEDLLEERNLIDQWDNIFSKMDIFIRDVANRNKESTLGVVKSILIGGILNTDKDTFYIYLNIIRSNQKLIKESSKHVSRLSFFIEKPPDEKESEEEEREEEEEEESLSVE